MDKQMFDSLPVKIGPKQGAALSSLLVSFALGYSIRKVQPNKEGFKLNGAQRLVVRTEDVNLLGGNIHTVKKNTEALLVTSKNCSQNKCGENLCICYCLMNKM